MEVIGNGDFTVHDPSGVRKRGDYNAAVRRLKEVARKQGVTEPGHGWLLQATDAFHDTPLQPFDYPSGNGDRFIVHEVTRAVSVTRPPNLTAGGTWDFHVTTNNWAGGTVDGTAGFTAGLNSEFSGDSAGMAYTRKGGLITEGSGASRRPYVSAPVLMHRIVAGSPTFTNVAMDPVALGFGAIDIPPQYLAGPVRVVGMAVEVVNTTSPLNISGRAVVYNYPSRRMEHTATVNSLFPIGTQVFNPVTPAVVGTTTVAAWSNDAVEAVGYARPPQTISEAELSHGSLSWHAREGAYFNARFEEEPELQVLKPQFTYWYSNDVLPGSQAGGSVIMAQPGGLSVRSADCVPFVVFQDTWQSTTSTGSNIGPFRYSAPAPNVLNIRVSRSGAYFTGLSEQTTLTVRARFFVARIPSVNEPDIYTLARSPIPRDLEVWEMYTRMLAHMPPGCMATENPLGEWFRKVASIAAKYAPVVGNALGTIGVPGAALIGNAVGKVGQVVKDNIPSKKQKEQKSVVVKGHSVPKPKND